jgi:hypothetical protein
MFLGWIGNALIVLGAWQIGHKRRWGFLLSIAGSSCWIAKGSLLGMTDLICIELVMSTIAARNYIKWRMNK